jgi:hypothetical protein
MAAERFLHGLVDDAHAADADAAEDAELPDALGVGCSGWKFRSVKSGGSGGVLPESDPVKPPTSPAAAVAALGVSIGRVSKSGSRAAVGGSPATAQDTWAHKTAPMSHLFTPLIEPPGQAPANPHSPSLELACAKLLWSFVFYRKFTRCG